MLTQIQVIPLPTASTKEKGDFFEDLIRALMEAQRYRVTQRINFTGTEIDLLCEHLDRPSDTAIVECKARTTLNSDDIKNFSFDVIVSKKAKYGFFAHTTELQHQVAGLASDLDRDYRGTLMFWGPEKIVDLLVHSKHITPAPTTFPLTVTPTKQILFYTHMGRFWVTIFSNQIVPTHYQVVDATNPNAKLPTEIIKWFSEFDEIKSLNFLPSNQVATFASQTKSFKIVAEIQEADEWDDYRPVGAKYFVGRSEIRDELYKFIQSPLNSQQGRRIFFVEGKSGWGKSSLIAELRSRCKNKKNKNTLWVFAVDSRGADTSEFATFAFAKMAVAATNDGFIPKHCKRPADPH